MLEADEALDEALDEAELAIEEALDAALEVTLAAEAPAEEALDAALLAAETALELAEADMLMPDIEDWAATRAGRTKMAKRMLTVWDSNLLLENVYTDD